MKKSFIKIAIAILTLAGVIPVVLYFSIFHNGITQIHSKWAEFGSFFSPIVGVLAFVGLLYSIEITKEQFKRQSEESGFFSLLNLHINRVNQINDIKDTIPTNRDAFQFYVIEFEKIYSKQCFYFAQEAITDDLEHIHNFGYRFLYQKIYNKECIHAGTDEIKNVFAYFKRNELDKDEALKGLVDGNCTDEDKSKMQSIGKLYFEDSSPEYRIKKLSLIYEHFDDNYGWQLGHYFQNIHSILEYIDSTEQEEKFINIYKSQLSRNELSLIFYNIMRSDPIKNFNSLIFKYTLFDNLYSPDLCYTAHDERLKKDLNTIKQKTS